MWGNTFTITNLKLSAYYAMNRRKYSPKMVFAKSKTYVEIVQGNVKGSPSMVQVKKSAIDKDPKNSPTRFLLEHKSVGGCKFAFFTPVATPVRTMKTQIWTFLDYFWQ